MAIELNVEDSPYFTAPEFKEKVIEHLPIRYQKAIPPHILHNMSFDVMGQEWGSLVIGVTTYLQADHLGEKTKTFDFTWNRSKWQSFKERHRSISKWRLFKVKKFKASVKIDIDSWATYPESTVVLPELGRPNIIRYMDYLTTVEG